MSREGAPTLPEVAPGDLAGAETLELLAAAPRYNRWQLDVVAPFLGRRILEVGSGIGNMSEQLLEIGPELLVATDTDPYYCARLAERFSGRSDVVIDRLSMPDPAAAARLGRHHLDTVIATNVVEHVEDDLGTVETMRSLLVPGGRAIILVPALPVLYGEMDRELGHFRRYTRAGLADLMRRAGLGVERVLWFNRVGVLGWWYNGRIRRLRRIPLEQLRTFDRLVPMLRLERLVPLPFGQSLIAVGRAP